jgi:hypothetical protein
VHDRAAAELTLGGLGDVRDGHSIPQAFLNCSW